MKKRLVQFILSICLIALTFTSVVYAVSHQSIFRSNEIVLQSTSLTFRLNNKTYFDEIECKDLNLVKGNETDFDLNVKLSGSQSVNANYQLRFSFVNEDNVEIIPEYLGKCVEVYIYNGDIYEFYCMLEDLPNKKIEGEMVTNYEDEYNFRLIYSSESSSEWDDLAKNENFKIKVNADCEVSTSEKYAYVKNNNDLTKALEIAQNHEVTIVLLEDMVINNELNFSNKVGFDLNGHNLTLNANVNINYTSTSDELNDSYYTSIGIKDSSLDKTSTISGTGIINISGDDAYLVSDIYIVSIDNKSTANINVNLDNQGDNNPNRANVFDSFGKLLSQRVEDVALKNEYYIVDNKAVFSDSTNIDNIFKDIRYLAKVFNIQIASQDDSKTFGGDILELNADYKLSFLNNLGYDVLYDSTYQYTLVYNYESKWTSDGVLSNAVFGDISFLGVSLDALCDRELAKIPNIITSSIYLRNYDANTKTYFEWIIDDGANNYALTDNGIFQAYGLDQLKIKLNNDFSNKKLNIMLKASKKESSLVYKQTFRTIEVVNLTQRTLLWYDNLPITIRTDLQYSVPFANFTDKFGVTNLDFLLNSGDFNSYLNFDKTTDSVTISASEENDIPVNYVGSGDLSVKIKYELIDYTTDSTYEKNFSFLQGISVIGEIKDSSKFDVKFMIESQFLDSPYTKKEGFEFLAYGALSPKYTDADGNVTYGQAYIDYEILGDTKDFISLIYDYYLATEINEQVLYFNKNGNNYEPLQYTQLSYIYEEMTFTEDAPYEKDKYYTLNTNGSYSLSNLNYNSSLKYYKRSITVDGVITDVYNKMAVFEILPSKVPVQELILGNVEAVVYTVVGDTSTPPTDSSLVGASDNGPVYYVVDPETGKEYKGYLNAGAQDIYENYRQLSFSFTFPIEGIIQYGPSVDGNKTVEDYSLYQYLLYCFDANHDGIISISESKADWETIKRTYNSYGMGTTLYSTSNGYEYLKFNGYKLSSIKGIELFRNIKGISFAGTDISDLTPLSSLYDIEYLDLSNNKITNLTGLEYLDNLKELNLSNNSIVSTEELRYLKSIKYLDISNNYITDFEPLTIMTTLDKLNIKGLKDGNTLVCQGADSRYYLALIEINNKKDNKYDLIADSGYTKFNTGDLIAAQVMRDLEDMNRFYKTLYLPLTYQYKDGNNVKSYKLTWKCEGDSARFLKLLPNSADSLFQSYQVEEPLDNKDITFTLEVSTGTTTYLLTRTFNVVLEKSEGESYIYTSATNKELASSLIPDEKLRNEFFRIFDKNNNSIIEWEEWNSYTALDFAFDNKNIVSLEGIGLLKDHKTGIRLDLTGNKIDDLSPLLDLGNSLDTLILGNYDYDFTTLIEDGRTLNNFKTLDVTKCYNIEENLNDLYDVYLTYRNLNIYMENTDNILDETDIAWDPYKEELAKRISYYPSVLAFSTVGSKYNLYNPFGESDFNDRFEFYFYEKTTPIKFYIKSSTLYETGGSKAFSVSGSTVNYANVNAWSESIYLKLKIQGYDSRGSATNLNITGYYTIQLNTIDPLKKIIIHSCVNEENNYNFYDMDVDSMDLGSFFGSLQIKNEVHKKLFDTIFNKGTNRYSGTLDDFINIERASTKQESLAWYLDDDGFYHITTKNLAKLTFGTINTSNGKSGYNIELVGSNGTKNTLTKGMRYLPHLTAIYFSRDCSFGDGKELINIIDYSCRYSAIDTTGLSTMLPNLKKLYMYDTYRFTFDESSFSKMTNLEILYLKKATDSNAKGAGIDDFNFLKGLINEENKSSLKELSIEDVKVSTSTGIGNYYARIVADVYNAARNNGIAKSSLKYKVGSVTKNSSSNPALYLICDQVDGEDVIFCDTSNTKNFDSSILAERIWSTSGVVNATDYDFSDLTKYNRDIVEGLGTHLSNLGLELDGTRVNITYDSNISCITSSNTIKLPIETGYMFYGITYDTNFVKSYPIRWSVIYYDNSGIKHTTSISTTITNPYFNVTKDLMSYTITPKAGANNFVQIYGEFSSGTKAYGCKYDFNVNNGDNIFSNITDKILRDYLFAKGSNIVNNNTLDLKFDEKLDISVFYDDFVKPLNKTKITVQIYKIDGLVECLDFLGVASDVKTLDLSNQKLIDVSNLFNENNGTVILSNLEQLNLSQIKAFIPNTISKLSKLNRLYLTNNLYFGAEDILNLPTSITELYISGTKCNRNARTILNIYNHFFLDQSGNRNTLTSIKIALNSETLSNYSEQILLAAYNVINFVNSNVGFDNMSIAQNAFKTSGGYKNTSVYNGTTFEYVVSGYYVSHYGGVKKISSNNVDVSAYIDLSKLSGTLFSDRLYTKLYFEPTSEVGTMNYTIGSLNKNLEEFDTEFIYYLVETGKLFLNNTTGNYELKANASINLSSISSELGIFGFEGFSVTNIKLSSSNPANNIIELKFASSDQYSISITLDKNYDLLDLLDYTSFDYYSGNSKINEIGPLSFYNNGMLLNNALINFNAGSDSVDVGLFNYKNESVASYVIYKDTEISTSIVLPKSIYNNYQGYDISYSTSGNGNITQGLSFNQNVLTINCSLMNKSIGAGTYTVQIKGTYGGNSATFLTITFIRGEDSSQVVITKEAERYFELDKEGDLFYLYDSNNNHINKNDEEEFEFTGDEVKVIDGATNVILGTYNDYKNKLPENPIYIISAGNIIESGRMRVHMHVYPAIDSTNNEYSDVTKGFLVSVKEVLNGTTIKGGYLYTKQIRLNVQRFTINEWDGIVTINGIQAFSNIKYFSMQSGAYCNMEVLKYLSLVTYKYNNTHEQNKFMIDNFYPLYQGSKDTLTSFEYNGFGNVQIHDLTFLIGFNKLKNVLIGCNNNGNNGDPAYQQLFKTSYFKYLLSELMTKGVKFYVSRNLANIGTNGAKLNSNFDILSCINSSDNSKVLLTNTSSQLLGSRYLNDITFDGIDNLTLISGFAIKVDYTSCFDGKKININLPAYFNENGTLNRITWEKGTDNYEFTGYIINGSYGNYSNNDILTNDQVDELLADINFYSAVKAGKVALYYNINIMTQNPNLLEMPQIIARVEANNEMFDRSFNFIFK